MLLTMTVLLPSELSSVSRARKLLAALLALAHAGEECRRDVALVITEACVNAVEHGDARGMVEVGVVIDPDCCHIEVANRGRTPHVGRLVATRPEPDRMHGRGLLLIQALTDTAAFVDVTDGRVVLRVTRGLAAVTPPGRL